MFGYQQEKPKPAKHLRNLLLAVLLLAMLCAFLALPGLRQWLPGFRASGHAVAVSSPTGSPTISATLTPPPPTGTSTISPTASPASALSLFPNSSLATLAAGLERGTVILAMDEGGYSHLFAYHPQTQPFSRLTSGDWDDMQPSPSPDGRRIAFTSNRDGFWDLYLLDLAGGKTTRLTETKEYDGAPSWSPDGRWLAYESYVPESGLELFIRPIDNSQAPIRLTEDLATDFSPAWSPQGRQIAFVSTRTGENEVWLADLDRSDNRFLNLSRSSQATETHPVWSPDGGQLVWSATTPSGTHDLFVWQKDSLQNAGLNRPRRLAGGDWAAWSPSGQVVLTSLNMPNQPYLTAYIPPSGELALPPVRLLGEVHGVAWATPAQSVNLAAGFNQTSLITPSPAWNPALTPLADIPSGRQRLVEIPDVQAPNPLLQDLVDESFNALRARAARQAGWDVLANLDNAFVPLTAQLEPGTIEDWLYTGRAFAFNPLPINAGWLVVVPEQYGAQIYWRAYLKARYQDGSQGMPLQTVPWDFTSRYSGNPRAYEAGGSHADAVPAGYWVDFTRLASSYGWERLPALITWRAAYDAARFNEFAYTDGLDWQEAMLEIYPAQALTTPTRLIPTTQVPTLTPRATRTPLPARWRTPSMTPTPTKKRG